MHIVLFFIIGQIGIATFLSKQRKKQYNKNKNNNKQNIIKVILISNGRFNFNLKVRIQINTLVQRVNGIITCIKSINMKISKTDKLF